MSGLDQPSGRPALNRRALGLALTRIANGDLDAAARTLPVAGEPAWRIGITGAPGAGKSTLTGRLALHRLTTRRIGVLAIDPSSPVTGGAILGDRIRMDDLAGVEDLYIRSFGSRSADDGLTENLPELLAAMDAAGFDEVLLETVGVGQAEVAVRNAVDTLLVVVPPDAGDAIQAMKAGLMEIADIFVVNKADMATAARMASEIQRIVTLTHKGQGGWTPPVLLTSANNPESTVALSARIDEHRAWLSASGSLAARSLARARQALRRRLNRRVAGAVKDAPVELFELRDTEQERALLAQITQALRP